MTACRTAQATALAASIAIRIRQYLRSSSVPSFICFDTRLALPRGSRYLQDRFTEVDPQGVNHYPS
jgi:hypothetical protein